MKKYFYFAFITLVILCNSNVKSQQIQVVDGLNYQAVVTDEHGMQIAGMDINGLYIPDKAINVKFSILKGSSNGLIEYQEIQTDTTDASGLFSCVIGHGTATSYSTYPSILKVPWDKDKHFLKVEIDIKRNGEFKEMGNEQMTAVSYAFYALNAMGSTPKGGIIMYSGDWNFTTSGLGTGNLEGWALCNGNNGTPDLSEKFVRGISDSTQLRDTSGTDSIRLTVAQLPSHTHTFTTNPGGGDTIPLTISSDGGHSHNVMSENLQLVVQGGGSGATAQQFGVAQGPYLDASNVYTSTDGTHSHPGSTVTIPNHSHPGITDPRGNNAAFDNRPKFIKLAFIMKL